MDGSSATRRQDNGDPAFLQPHEPHRLVLPCRRNILQIFCLKSIIFQRIRNLPTSDKTTEMSQYRAGESSNSCNNNSFNTNSFNTISFQNVQNVNNFGSTDEKDKILAWISPLEPKIRHHDIRAQRVEQVGDWLFQREEYRNWFDGIRGGESDNSALFCYGDPGVGKTYIT